ncbi:MAG: class I SAM-dependent methyltransferase [Actinomycetota bacterium]|nr:class I SAM-dependent methyltransferase [Actinomycetota bacterium]
MPATEQPATDEVAERIFNALVGAMELNAIYLGDRLGFYQELAGAGPRSSGWLAERTGVLPRYAREWCEAQAASGLLACDNPAAEPDDRRFELPGPVAEVLLDQDSLAFLAPSIRCSIVASRALPELVRTYRGERTLGWEDHGPEMRHGQAQANRPIFRRLLVQDWLARLPEVRERLGRAGARVAEVGCGMGWASIALAQGFPGLHVDGYDIDAPSIEAARHNAAQEGLQDRVRFHVADISDVREGPFYDAVFAFECLHDMRRPVDALAAKRALGSGSDVLVVDERTEDNFTPNASPMERLLYGYSLTVCLPDGLSATPSAGTGTVMRASTMGQYAEAAGFAHVNVVDLGHDQFRLYQLVG